MKIDLDEIRAELAITKQKVAITEAFLALVDSENAPEPTEVTQAPPAARKPKAASAPRVLRRGSQPGPAVALLERGLAGIPNPFTLQQLREHCRLLDPEADLSNIGVFLKRRLDKGILTSRLDGVVTWYTRAS